MWVSRSIEKELTTLVRRHPVVALIGPRQSGKTSLLKRLFPKFTYYSLDEPGIQNLAREDPNALLSANTPTILDEVQTCPELFPYIKASVDKNRRSGRFLLTGSQNLLIHSHISESLAGRAVYLNLLSFDMSEWQTAKRPLEREKWLDYCSYPEPFLHPGKRDSWLKGYIQTYLERDVRQVAEVGNLRDFSRFLRALALRNGQMLNFSDIGRDVSVAPNTVKRWISILEASFQIVLLEPYFSSRTRRLIKSSKLYFTEPWIAWHLSDGPPRDPGIRLETTLVAAIYRWAAHSEKWRLHYFRTKEGAEVDLVLEPLKKNRGPLLAAEIKHTKTFSTSLLRGLKAFDKTVQDKNRLFLVSYSDEPSSLGPVTLVKPSTFFESVLKY